MSYLVAINTPRDGVTQVQNALADTVADAIAWAAAQPTVHDAPDGLLIAIQPFDPDLPPPPRE